METDYYRAARKGERGTRHRLFTILLRSGNPSDLEILIPLRFNIIL